MAKSTDANTWSSFDEAVRAYQMDERYEGVGFVFAADDPYCGVDLDDCVDPSTGALKKWGQQFTAQLDSYSEISPSGMGVKVIVQARKPGRRCKKAFEDGAVEIYDHDRFFTVTGDQLANTPSAATSRQEVVDALYQRVFGTVQPVPERLAPNPPPPIDSYGLSPDEIVETASRSRRSGKKFASLWAGNWIGHFSSQSEADSSLIFSLAFYTKDVRQIDAMFRRSGLFRPKWDELHGSKTYGQLTIDNAVAKVTGQYRVHRPTQRTAVVSEGDEDAERDDQGMIALGQREPKTNRLVLSPRRTLPTAEAFIRQFYAHAEGRTLHSYAGTWLVWRGNRFVEIEEESLRQKLQSWLHGALHYQFHKRLRQTELVGFESNPSTIRAALDSIRAHTYLPASVTPPAWLDDRTSSRDVRNLLPFPSGTLDLATNEILPPTPALFNINAIDFEYEANPQLPRRWLQFLEQLWGDDIESVQLLQEWMGYSLVADTCHQKMLLIVGPRRSGKGTIGRVLSSLVGIGNVAGPTIRGLAGSFGLQPLIAKSLAIVSDARFSGEHVGTVVERLLCISGEDPLTVDRKFLGSVTMKLPTRFVFLTNELPDMNDASGALAGRFVVARLMKSFYGQEDTTLTHQLMSELPGILVWAIAGLNRLRARGKFIQPEAGSDAVQEMEDLASPVLAFVRDCCEVGAGRRTWIDDIYKAWKRWCESGGCNTVTSRQVFGRDLAAAVPGVVRRRNSIRGRFYDGIALRNGGAT